MFVVVQMMGIGRDDWGPRMVRTLSASSSGDAGSDGPVGDEVRDRRKAGEDREAAFARAVARCGSCSCRVSIDRRDGRWAADSTRLNMVVSSGVASSSSEDSHSSPSSSMALSEVSSSSSSSLSMASSSSVSASSIFLD